MCRPIAFDDHDSTLEGLARDPFRCGQASSTGFSSWAYGASWQTVSQSRAAISPFHGRVDLDVQVVPDDHERHGRAAWLEMRDCDLRQLN
jgi:hypothetical protein